MIYDNHQFHTSSWLEPGRGNGFPISLFKNNSTAYPEGGGGAPKYQSAKVWWHDLWSRSIKDTNGTDAWTRQANFLKTIVNAVDKHPSTLGYEILNEPQVHYSDEWQMIGNYNTFITNELRSLTQKTIFFSQQIPAGTKILQKTWQKWLQQIKQMLYSKLAVDMVYPLLVIILIKDLHYILKLRSLWDFHYILVNGISGTRTSH